MERKFASKLSQLKPAAEARKQAQSQLKETIQMNKYRPIDPVDDDQYVEANQPSLRKDAYYPQLVAMPTDDIYAEQNSLDEPASETGSLFVSDCLNTYRNRRYEVKYRYHAFGGNFRQLPMNSQTFNGDHSAELYYEVDFDEASYRDQKVSDSPRWTS